MTIRSARPEDLPDIARVHVASWRTTYRSLLPAAFLAGLSADEHESRHRQAIARPGVTYLVAEDDAHAIVGFASGGPERSDHPTFQSELYAMYLLEAHQRKGFGSSLVRELAAHFHGAGRTSMLAWVFADNPGRRFYERIGGAPFRTESIEIGGVTLDVVAYGWSDTGALSRPPGALKV